jgi:purine-binding chemotaxis protein CheW
MIYTQLVVFKIGSEEYGIAIEKVREIINYVPVTKLPEAPAYLEGVIDVRGKIVPIVNFTAKLGILKEPTTKQIVIVEWQGKEVGLTVEMVTEVIPVVGENIADVGSIDAECERLDKVYKFNNRIIILIDVEKVLMDAVA